MLDQSYWNAGFTHFYAGQSCVQRVLNGHIYIARLSDKLVGVGAVT